MNNHSDLPAAVVACAKPSALDCPKPNATRRDFLRAAGALTIFEALARLAPSYAQTPQTNDPPTTRHESVSDTRLIDLLIGETTFRIGDRAGTATTVNGTLPGPLLRLREGEEVEIRVTNQLLERASIHWHGILLPNDMDGVPGVTFKGIDPGETFVYRFPVRQYGTYWYHSHSGMQEQRGLYGPLIFDPAAPEPFAYDREHVVILSDWTFEDPHALFSKLKKQADFSNLQKQTLVELFSHASEKGFQQTFGEWLAWSRMRMDPTDIADLTGTYFTYLINGRPPEIPWTGIFRRGERVRLRFINSAATTHYDVRIPGLEMTIVQADGQHVHPVRVEEFRMGAAETYDVIINPPDDRAYALFAETTDRSGFALGVLAPREGMLPPIPEQRKRPVQTMDDMMGMHGSTKPTTHQGQSGTNGMGHEQHTSQASAGQDSPATSGSHDSHGAHDSMGGHAPAPQHARSPSDESGAGMSKSDHSNMEMPENTFGPGNAMMAMNPRSLADEPGLGLGKDGRRVLVYRDLVALDSRQLLPPGREVVLNLTGNMERFIWGFDGKKYSESEPVYLKLGERVRITFVNHTMMEHPLHLHGMFMELENGAEGLPPLKHTVVVKSGEKLSVLVTADAPGDWAFHCHLQYHMEAGMFRIFNVG